MLCVAVFLWFSSRSGFVFVRFQLDFFFGGIGGCLSTPREHREEVTVATTETEITTEVIGCRGEVV